MNKNKQKDVKMKRLYFFFLLRTKIKELNIYKCIHFKSS